MKNLFWKKPFKINSRIVSTMSIRVPKDIIHGLDASILDRLEKAVTIVEKNDDHNPVSFGAKKGFRPKKEICTLYYHHDTPVPEGVIASTSLDPKKKPKKKSKRDLFVDFVASLDRSIVMDHFFLPFACAIRFGFRDYRPDIPKITGWPPFLITLREEQQVVLREAVDILSKESCVLVAMYPGGGKTMTTIRLARILGHATLIIVNRVVLMDQWRSSIERCLGPNVSVQCVDAQNPPIKGNLFYIINALNIPKLSTKAWAFGLDIGTVVVDECHLILTTIFAQSLGSLCPRFLIGLSATPYRYDGMNDLFNVYFGAPSTVIHRPLRRHHYVYPLTTPIRFQNEYDVSGRLIWNKIINDQALHPQRLEWIAKLCGLFSDRFILVLGKRIEGLDQLSTILGQKGESITVFTASDVAYDPSARIMLSTFAKVGTGFSHDRLDMLILMNDCEDYFLQYLGRVFRRPDVVPLIFDIVDKHQVLQNHYRTRKRLYTEVGGEMKETPPEWTEWTKSFGRVLVSSTSTSSNNQKN